MQPYVLNHTLCRYGAAHVFDCFITGIDDHLLDSAKGEDVQVVRRPAIRQPRPEVERFALLSTEEAASGKLATQQAAGAPSARRWTIPAGGAVDVWLSFESQELGVYQQSITFEVLMSYMQATSVAACPEHTVPYKSLLSVQVKKQYCVDFRH